MTFDVAAVLILLGVSVYTLYKKQDSVPAILITADFALCSSAATSLSNSGLFEGIAFYMWFAVYGSLRFGMAAMISAWAVFYSKSRFLSIPAIAYFLYGIFCFLIIIQYIPNGAQEYPLIEILPLYDYYEIVHYLFAVLVLFVLIDIGSGGRVVRLPFYGCLGLFRHSDSVSLSKFSTGQGYDRISDDQRE